MKPAKVNFPGPTRYKVGDRVTFVRGFDTIPAVVTEDRGPIGYKGRRLYGIRYQLPDSEPRETVWPEDELSPAPPSP